MDNQFVIINFNDTEAFKTLNAYNDNYEESEKEILDNDDLFFIGQISIS